MKKTKLGSMVKNIIGGNKKMKTERKNIFGATFTVLMFICSMFASFIAVTPVALAANGLGEVTKFQNEAEYPVTPPDYAVQTVNTEKDIIIWLHNDEPVGGNCIDEIIVTFPSSWGGSIDLGNSGATNLGTTIESNEADGGDYTSLTGNDNWITDNSIRIVPDYANDGVQLCPSGTTMITIHGLTAPSSPEDSTIMIMTSDEDHNEPSGSYVRQPIDVLPMIKVTDAEELKIEYVQIINFDPALGADYKFSGKAWGAWGMLDELYISGSSTNCIVYLDNGDGSFTVADTWNLGSAPISGLTTVSLSYTDSMDIGSKVENGFIKDGQQALFFINCPSDNPTLQILGHVDSARYLDPSVVGTGFEGTAEGTVIKVKASPVAADGRKIKVQLVRDDGGKWLDVKEQGIPIYYTTDLGSFTEASPEPTDANGESEINLLPGTVKGIADVDICFPDVACVDEQVGINADAAYSCAITKGLDVSVEAGDIVEIEATVYDQFGNVITNVPDQELVEFDLTSKPDTDASLDDDTTPGPVSNHEEELTELGIADTYLYTSATIGTHTVHVTAEGLDCGTTTITGVLGQADAVECFPVGIADAEIDADDCFDMKVYITDKNGNRLSKWESIVQISLSGTNKYIESTDLREEKFIDSQTVQGKLNNNDPAYANVRVCGCDSLGTLDVFCKSDTLDDDTFRLNVINSDPDCIDVMPSGFDECSPGEGTLSVSILDTCGNPLVDQECAEGGFASSCVKLEASCGVLSTNKTCVDLRNTGYAPDVKLDISGCPCPEVTVTATDEPDCCPSVYQGALPMCDAVSIGIIGPIYRTELNVYPKAENQQPDQFYVSEKTVVELRQYDECDQLRECEDSSIDIELQGEDCVDTSIQVDSPLDLTGGCKEGPMSETLYKLVIENCADPEKQGLEPAWTDLPEQNDIVVDKFAFQYTGDPSDTICIYEETEKEAGFQESGTKADKSWGCWQLNSNDRVLNYDSTYIVELDTRVSKFKLGEYDNQRMGGVIIRPGDTKDFYFVLQYTSECDYKDIDYLYFQDYNSPDWMFGIGGGNARDTMLAAEPYTHRNDDYMYPDPYPVESHTWGYGFGDRVIYNVPFINGVAKAIFRDLVAEQVSVLVNGFSPAMVTFKPQPATQVVALNHDEPPQMACSDEGYDVNLQVTDGFQNPVGLATKVQLESCLTFPMFLYFQGADSQEIEINYWNHRGIGRSKDPRDVCFDMEEFKAGVEEIINELMRERKIEPSNYLATILAENTEFTKMLEEIFEDKTVIFEGAVTDEYGHDVVYTDSNGQATFRVASDDSSMFNIKWMDTHFRIFTIPVALDADYFDLSFTPGEPYQYDIMALPETGIPADGEQEAKLLIRKLDQCGNPVFAPQEYVTVSVDGSAIISRDFDGNNNYDQDVTGYFRGCCMLWPFLEDCSLTVLNDVVETVTVTVTDASGDSMCVGYTPSDDERCGIYTNELDCTYYECIWVTEGDVNQPDSIDIEFVGAPRNLKITEIKHSDLLPADGFMPFRGGPQMPVESCDQEQMQRCHFSNEPEICFQTCKQYGGSGAWVTVEVQDKYGKRVTGYLGDGLKGDPGDKYGLQDNIFENICIALDDKRAFIDDFTFGWLDLHAKKFGSGGAKVYCGDLAFGKGSVHIAYQMLDRDGQPLDARETASVVVSVFDKCDSFMWKKYGFQSKPSFWDDECNGQEFNENNLPDSETASKLTPDYGQLDFVAVADRWDINANKVVVAADGQDYAILTINPENEYMDVRASMEATVQSSLLGSTLESEQIHPECYVEGLKDPLNPTSIIVNTEDCSGGQAKLKMTSTEPGTARVTVTGNGYGCKEYINGYEYTDWFEMTFGHGDLHGDSFSMWFENCYGSEFGGSMYSEMCSGFTGDFEIFGQHCVADGATLNATCLANAVGVAGCVFGQCAVAGDALAACDIEFDASYEEWCGGFINSWGYNFETCYGWEMWSSQWGEFCGGFEGVSYHEFYHYHEMAFGSSTTALSELYTPYCIDWGIIPLTPKTIDIEFKQSFQNKIELKKGWNFFSIPKELDVSNDQWSELGLSTICDASCMWNDASQTWTCSVPAATVVVPMEGYWCKAAEAATISVTPMDTSGAVYLPPVKTIYPKWNDVGLSTYVEMKMEHALISIDSVYTQILDWIEDLQRYVSYANTGENGGGSVPGTTGTNNMEAGQGYFIWATDDGDLAGLS